MSLLFATHPLIVNPELAALIGLNEAIVLQQVHYWLKDTSAGVEIKGQRWIYNTAKEWLKQFPFWSESTIKRAIASLEDMGLLEVEQQGKKKRDMTNYFTINYDSELLTSESPTKPAKQAKKVRKHPSIQNDEMDVVNLNSSISSDCADATGQNESVDLVNMTRSIGSNWHDDLTETTTEITTENLQPSCPDASLPDEPPVRNFADSHPDAVVYSVKKRQWGTQQDLDCAKWLWKKIISLYEKAAETDGDVSLPKEPNWTTWANEVRLMVQQDNRTHRQICELLGRAQRDPFWCRNILSPSKLREKWDELTIKLSGGQHTGRDDPNFKASYDNVDYSTIPEGFRS